MPDKDQHTQSGPLRLDSEGGLERWVVLHFFSHHLLLLFFRTGFMIVILHKLLEGHFLDKDSVTGIFFSIFREQTSQAKVQMEQRTLTVQTIKKSRSS